MNFDFAKTLSLVKGGLTDHEATWKSYLDEKPGWQQVATELTGPLILANVVLSVILSRVIGGYFAYGYHSSFLGALFWGLVMACIGFVIAVLVFNFLAGQFKGKSDFSRAFAAVSLAAIPAWVAGAVAALIPWIGWLIALAGAIVSLVFLYRIMPLALEVPEDKRMVHFIVSIVAIIVINMIVGSVLSIGAISEGVRSGSFSDTGRSSRAVTGAGMFGEMERQGRLMEAAENDVYEPPANGKLDEDQVVAYYKVQAKTRAMQEDYARKMQEFQEEMDAKEKAGEKPSASDLRKMYSGIGGVVSATNAEMEVVKTGDGNWAEHTWVKEQLRIAKIQQGEGSDAIEHNYELLQKYAQD